MASASSSASAAVASTSASVAATGPIGAIIPFTLPDEEIDKYQCKLLGPLALIVQAVMAVVVLTSLMLKRARERPKRPWKIWTGDVSKQLAGQAMLHGLNLLISGLSAFLCDD